MRKPRKLGALQPLPKKTALRYSEDNWPKAKTIGGEPWPAASETTGAELLRQKRASQAREDEQAALRAPKLLPRPVALPEGIPMVDQNSPTWPVVLAFAFAMEYKLSLNRRKGDVAGWRKDGTAKLQDRLDDEIEELNAALWNEATADKAAVLLEAADVANYSMMIADCVQHDKQ